MQIATRHRPGGTETEYLTDWHTRGTSDMQHARRITITRQQDRSPFTGAVVQAWWIKVVDLARTPQGQEQVIAVHADGGVSTYTAALKVLASYMRQAIRDGYAHKQDMETVPSVKKDRSPPARV